MFRSNSSRNNQTSSHSLCSQGPVDLETLDGTDKKTRKPCAKWTTKEETIFVEFLLSQCSSSGNGSNFKKYIHCSCHAPKEQVPKYLRCREDGQCLPR
ncbi:hypothetical protein BS17DRAFT_722228 [Gyrodon lividus]|nr:hypothetical protein BS17DRAFT_722228 [Gyrodon lividus]